VVVANTQTTKKIRVLVADDSFVMRNSLKRIFEATNIEIVAEAATGIQACYEYAHHKPDVVTMDINMPVMDGLAALKLIIENDPDAKVIMVSTENQKRMLFQAIKMGAKHYLVKPINKDKMIKTIIEVCDKL
jgi:two-component system, chemotaxis family, chemotaxis protein CheY